MGSRLVCGIASDAETEYIESMDEEAPLKVIP